MSTSQWLLSVLFPSLPIGVALTILSNYLLYYFIFKADLGTKFLGSRRHSKATPPYRQALTEIKHAIIPECLLSVIFTLILNSNRESPLRHLFSIRWDLNGSEAPRIALECFIIFWAYEIYYFFLHRALHRPALFRYFHDRHHRSLQPTPLTSTSVNLLEAVSFYSFYVVLVFSPVHILSLAIIGLNIKFASLTQHSGHEVFPIWVRKHKYLKYINSTYFHHLHHSDRFNRNYGFQTSFLDRYFKTVNPLYEKYEQEK